jgi:hypothetical protein
LIKTIAIGIAALLLIADFAFIFVMNSQACIRPSNPRAGGYDAVVHGHLGGFAGFRVFLHHGFIALFCLRGGFGLPGPAVQAQELLAAKMASYIFTNVLIGVFILMVSAIVYGVNEAPPCFSIFTPCCRPCPCL